MKNRRHNLIQGGIVVCILVFTLTGYLISHNQPPKEIPVITNTVNLTPNGFSPKKIAVEVGATVTFYNKTANSFWPASNFHPAHTLYSDFDPKKPIAPGSSWSFTFEKAGVWEYHDHLAPYFDGEVMVGTPVITNQPKNCGGTEDEEKMLCLGNALKKLIEKGELSQAFTLIKRNYENDTDTVFCHDLSHRLGEETYTLFIKNRDIIIPPETSLCNYGFYHGFMETLLRTGRTTEEARMFCDLVENKIGENAPDVRLQCFHGIGHGAVGVYRPQDYGNEKNMLAGALSTCSKVSENEEEMYRCASGAFNGIGFSYRDGTDGLVLKKNDPLWICRLQEERLQEGCYGNVIQPIITLLGGEDFSRIARWSESIENDVVASKTMYYTSFMYAEIFIKGQENFPVAIDNCRLVEKRLFTSCLNGVVSGIMEGGLPGKQHILGFTLCRSQKLDEEEKRDCFRYSLNYLGGLYSKQEFVSICSELEEGYRIYCPK